MDKITCPLCGKPECTPDGGTTPLLWSDFCQTGICGQCNLELNMAFYDRDSALFANAAKILGLDIWECRKRYLEDSVEKTRAQLHNEVDKIIRGFVNSGILRCTRQIEAISAFLAERADITDPRVLAEREAQLEEFLARSQYGGTE